MTDSILNHLHTLISQNVLGSKQYENRYKGFIGELDFHSYLLEKDRTIYSGGYFLPVASGSSSLQDPVYFNVSKDDPINYIDLFSMIKKVGCANMYFIRWENSDWRSWRMFDVMKDGRLLPIPNCVCYNFDMNNNIFRECAFKDFIGLYVKKSRDNMVIDDDVRDRWIFKMSRYDECYLLDLYVQRLFFDGFIGFGRLKGMPSDIDFIVKNNLKNMYTFIEVKEKNLSKNGCFGMDVARIKDILSISDTLKVNYLYVVKMIDNQKDRRFVNWMYIGIQDFIANSNKGIVEGGTGMKSQHSSNPTILCDFEHFKLLN